MSEAALYRGAVRIDDTPPEPVVSINDPDRVDWIGKVESHTPSEMPPDQVEVTLLESERAGETALALFVKGNDGKTLYLNGKTPFEPSDDDDPNVIAVRVAREATERQDPAADEDA